jgi:PAS domain S-box-containing protein
MSFYRPGKLTIRRRLPLLITALILSILLLFGVISYLGVRKSALQAGEQRLENSSLQLANMLSNSVHNAVTTAHGQANEPAIQAYFKSGGKDSVAQVEALFERFREDTSYLGSELVNAEGKKIFPLTGTETSVPSAYASFLRLQRCKGEVGIAARFFMLHDTVCYPVIATVSEDDKLLGYILKWRKIQTRGGFVDQVIQLIGRGSHFYLGNNDASLWTNMKQRVPSLPYVKPDSNVLRYRNNGETILAHVRGIGHSEWLVSVEFPEKQLLQAADNYLYWMVIGGSFLLLLGAFCGWLMSRNISLPLADLTAAASRIAANDYHSSPVPVHRLDEIGKLARAFMAMSQKVQRSKVELQKEAANYKLLFQENPMPIWIVSTPDHDVMDVNKAALAHYGYSRDEFLALNSAEMRPAEDRELFLKTIHTELRGGQHHGVWRHLKKDGTIFTAEVFVNDINYKGRNARLVLANDITEKLKAEAEVIRHRVKQQEIITETTIQVQEKEREEIGKELHDNINQVLASAKLYLELAKNGSPELTANAISRGYDNINLAMGEIRRLSKQLVRPAFDTSLTEALRDMTGELQAIALFEIDFRYEQFDEEVADDSIKLMIYRIVQEQLNNIIKHAEASYVYIELRTDGDNVYLRIMDNGAGFDTSQKSKGIGLRNIENRVDFHKGVVNIDSKPGSGCRIEISVPFRKESFPGSKA